MVMTRGSSFMKKLALVTAAILALSSVAASAQTYGVGKGKAPPPVVTKG
jgi:hypothetical protein